MHPARLADGPGRHLEVTSQVGVLLRDLLDGFAHPALHRDARALGGGSGATLPAAQPDRPRDLIGERVDFET